MKNLIACLSPLHLILALSNMISQYNRSSVMKKQLGLNLKCRPNRTYADNFRLEVLKFHILSTALTIVIIGCLALILTQIL